jgi:hypothetical protein
VTALRAPFPWFGGKSRAAPLMSRGAELGDTTGVLLDPPYPGVDDTAYDADDGTVSTAVRSWCEVKGALPNLRIALCGHDGVHDALLEHGWSVRTWAAKPGYASSERARANVDRERIWFSPHCLPIDGQGQLFAETS